MERAGCWQIVTVHCAREGLPGGKIASVDKKPTPMIVRWLPSVILMGLIFILSGQPASRLPVFGEYDLLIKKLGHATGYALLGLAYYIALPPRLKIGYRWMLALLMAVLFALSDEFHQSFIEGRTSSLVDVVIDTGGAGLALTAGAIYSSNSSSKSIS
jgi:VanZ family protein